MYVCVCVCFKIEVKFTQYAVHDLKACGSVVAVRVLSPSVVFDSATLWTAARQAPLSMGFSRQEYVKVKVKLLSRIRLFATPWTVAYQAPLSMGFSRQ